MRIHSIQTAFIAEALQYAGLPMSSKQPKTKTLDKLAESSQRSHAKFLRQMMISCVVTAPAFWWTEFDTYKIGVTRMSTSTMHTLLKTGVRSTDFEIPLSRTKIADLNNLIERTQDIERIKSELPSGYLYTSFVTLNYEVLRTIYADRRNHKLPQWQTFLKAFNDIPLFERFIGECLL
jgi:hypothetical protein